MNQFWENNECIWNVKVFVEIASIQQPSSNKTPIYDQCRDKCNTKHIKGEKDKMNNSGGIWNVDKHQEHDQTLGTQWVPRTWCAYLTLGMWWTLSTQRTPRTQWTYELKTQVDKH